MNPHENCGCFWGYGRASTVKQVMSVSAQEDLVRSWYDTQSKVHEDFTSKWGGWFEDPATSSIVDWMDRPVGQIVWERMDKGDIVVAAKFDRLFRSDADYIRTREAMAGRGCAFLCLDMPFIDLRTPAGRMQAGIMASVKQYEREIINERTREALAFKRAHGLPQSTPSVGWKIRTVEGLGPVFEEDQYARKVGDYIVTLKSKGFGFRAIAKILTDRKIKNPLGTRRDKCFTKSSVARWFTAATSGYPLPEGVDPCTESQLRKMVERGAIKKGRRNG